MTSLHVPLGLRYSYPAHRLSSSLNDENQMFFGVFPLMFLLFLFVCITVDKLKFTLKRGQVKERGRTSTRKMEKKKIKLTHSSM